MEIFTIRCQNVAVTARQDIFCAYETAGKKLRCVGIEIAANGQTTVGNYPISIQRLAATVTAGSGGTAVTPQNVNPNGAASGFTARANDTTQATSVTAGPMVGAQFNPINGYVWQPPLLEAAPKADLSGAISLRL